MHDLDTLIRLNDEAAARELGRKEVDRVEQAYHPHGYLYLVAPHPGHALNPAELRKRFTLIKGGKL